MELKKLWGGIISWTTRAHLGIESKIKATTGFQSQGYTQPELVSYFKDILKGSEKSFEFIQKKIKEC